MVIGQECKPREPLKARVLKNVMSKDKAKISKKAEAMGNK